MARGFELVHVVEVDCCWSLNEINVYRKIGVKKRSKHKGFWIYKFMDLV
jgi:hypothetical protein